MALNAWAIDEVPADAQVMRNAMASLIGAKGGLGDLGDFQITQKGTPNMGVLIATGEAWVPGTVVSSQGPYFVENTATYELPIEAAGFISPRVDTIVVRIKDATYEGAERKPTIEALKGKEEGGVLLEGSKSAGLATVPPSCLVLGYVLVKAKATSIVGANIENSAEVFSREIADKDLVAERALIKTGNAYGTLIERIVETEYEPNFGNTRTVFVILSLLSSEETVLEIEVGGRVVGFLARGSGNPDPTVSFLCPPKTKYRVKKALGASPPYFSSYLVL